MLINTVVLAVACTFNLANTNTSQYDIHSVFTGVFQPRTICVYDDREALMYEYNFTITFYGDLYFDAQSDPDILYGRSWAISISQIKFEYDSYILEYGQDPYYAGSLSYTYSDFSYNVSVPEDNVIFDNDANTGNFAKIYYTLQPDFDESYLSCTLVDVDYSGNNNDVLIWSQLFSISNPDYNDSAFGAGIRFHLGTDQLKLRQYMDSYTFSSGGYSQGYTDGYTYGFENGSQEGYSNGYTQGIDDALSTNSTAMTIFNGILNVALVPINFFLAIFNWEILGINLAQFVSALLSVACIVILLRVVFSGGSKK